MKNRALKVINAFLLFALSALFILFSIFGAVRFPVAYAAESEEVLQDLRRDKDFDENNYPYIKDDYGLYVIQIAESANKELFVYVYQPCHDTYDLKGTKISISYGYSVDGSGLKPKLYNLRLMSTSGTLDKYHVEGFTVPNDGERYYNIVEIFRMVNSDIDEVDEAFPKTDIAYSVGQQWCAYDLNDNKRYEMNTFNTLYVETVFIGNLTFMNGYQLRNIVGIYPVCDCWFYCFNQEDYVIKHIYDADLDYSIRNVTKSIGLGASGEPEYSNERKSQGLTLRDTDKMTFEGSGLTPKNYEWNRILPSKEFVETAEKQGADLSGVNKEKILSSQWVFTFIETERKIVAGGGYTTTFYSDVYDVGVLRLHFQDISGKQYDLGVVNDLADPDDIADGIGAPDYAEEFAKFWKMFIKVILIIVGVILLFLLLNIVTPVMSVFKFIFKAVFFVISLPFKLLKSIFKRRQ